MARPLRVEQAGGWYHITSRGIDRKRIFLDDVDRRHWLELLAKAVEIYRLIIHGYVLMENHFHSIIQIQETNLAWAMQWLNTSYSMWFNRRRRRVGPLLQGRYKAVLVDPVEWGLELSRYVHLNPVRIGRLGLDKAARQADRVGAGARPDSKLVQERLEHLRTYRWSSYRAYVGREPEPAWLETRTVLDLIGRGTLKQQRQAYREHVEQAVRQGLVASRWESLTGQLLLGGENLVQKARKAVRAGKSREQPHARSLANRPSIQAVIRAVEGVKGERWKDFCERHNDWGRDLVLLVGRRHCGLPLQALGDVVGGLDYAAVSAAIKRMELRMQKEKHLQQILHETEKQILNVET